MYDLVLAVSPLYAMQKKFRTMYKKLTTLDKNMYFMDNPDVFIQKAVLNHSIKNVIEYIKKLNN